MLRFSNADANVVLEEGGIEVANEDAPPLQFLIDTLRVMVDDGTENEIGL